MDTFIASGCVKYVMHPSCRRNGTIESQNGCVYTVDNAGYAQIIENPSNQANMKILVFDDKSKAQYTSKTRM